MLLASPSLGWAYGWLPYSFSNSAMLASLPGFCFWYSKPACIWFLMRVRASCGKVGLPTTSANSFSAGSRLSAALRLRRVATAMSR
ncbi:hypothetical protein D3C79_732530 [compost metagenome]